MAAITYKCPRCGGDLRFQPSGQRFVCEYCDSEYSKEELEENAVAAEEMKLPEEAEMPETAKGLEEAEMSETAKEPEEAEMPEVAKQPEKEQDAVRYICPSCGAEIVTDETTAATFCYYCHNPIVLEGRMRGSFHPDLVIPFAIDRKRALEIFHQWMGKKKYVPKDFYSEDQIEKLSGVYFPYWLYDCQVDGRLEAQGTKLSTWRMGDIQYTKTEQYDVSRRGEMQIEHVPRNALSKANRELAEAVFPFEMSKLQPFEMGYLSGFMAENRDMEQQQFAAEVEAEVRGFAEQSLRSGINGYQSVQVQSSDMRLLKPQWKYALLPVWTLTYKEKKTGKLYYFACNGQTGKVCGELPVDSGKLGRLFLSVFVPVAAVLLAAAYFLG